MNLKKLYLLLCFLGTLLPYSQFIPWIRENGLNVEYLFRQLFANRISGFFGTDVLLSAVVLLVFILVEGKRLGMRTLWLPIAAMMAVGVSLGLPLFLFLREQVLEHNRARLSIAES